MAIVRMKKLRVMAMASDQSGLVRKLLHLGCVEISEPEGAPESPEWAELMRRSTSPAADTRTQAAEVAAALAALRKYAPVKTGLFDQRRQVSEEEFLSADTAEKAKSAAKKINDLLHELAALQTEEGRLSAKRASLTPWSSLELPLETAGTSHALYRFGVCPSAADIPSICAALNESPIAAELLEISADRQQHYLLLVCFRPDEAAAMELLRGHGFSAATFPGVTGTAAENVAQIEQTLVENRARQEEITARLTASGDARPALQLYADQLNTRLFENTNTERLLTDGTVVFFEGWAPVDAVPRVEKLLLARDCAYDLSDPKPEEYPSVPIQLKNNRLTRPLNMVTEMYSLPAYDGLDPNPLMMPFFVLFYGIMMADMAYGILMVAASLVVLKKAKPRGGMRNFSELLGLCGVSTFLMGALTGSFFGDFIPQLAKLINPNTTLTSLPSLFTPLSDTISILIGSLVLGFIQVLTGMIINFVKQTKDGHFLDVLLNEGAWWTILAGAGLMILKVGGVAGKIVLIVGIVMMVLGATRGKKGFGKAGAVLGAVYNGVTGLFQDTLSYSRLMALMLSGSIIAQVFNTLGTVTGNPIGFVIISMIGNALNFALNLLGCYVHDLRLQCLEFFGRFYKDGGKPFRPLTFQTKFVDIKEEN